MSKISDAEIDGICDALDAWSPMVASGYEVPAASLKMKEAVLALRQLMTQRDEAREALNAAVLAEREACAAIFDDGVEIDFTGDFGTGRIEFPGKTFTSLIRGRSDAPGDGGSHD